MEVRFQSSSGIEPVTSNALTFLRRKTTHQENIYSHIQLNNSREGSGEDGRLQSSDVANGGRASAFDCRIESGVLHAGRTDGKASAQLSTQVPLLIVRLNSPFLEYGVQNLSCTTAPLLNSLAT